MADPSTPPRAEAVPDQPVRFIPTDDRTDPTTGTALCLSGGGYRAMLFHLGALWRLNEFGRLHGLDRVSSVSGGSITAAALGQAWTDLRFDGDVASGLGDHVISPVRELARHTLDETAIAIGILTPGTIGDHLADAYAKHLFGSRTLQDLPDDPPRFILNATNLASGELWRFSKPYMADWRVGMIQSPDLPLSKAVAASSSFPPVLSPFTLELGHADWKTVEGNDLTDPSFRSTIELTDGGVYDNLGLETAWKACHTVLVSDAGGHMGPDASPPRDWVRQALRVGSVVDNQVRALRKRQVVNGYQTQARAGAYWGIRDDIAKLPAPNKLPCPFQQTLTLAETPTRLESLEDVAQERLINWGYAICDAAVRSYVDSTLSAPDGFPYPDAGVG